MICCVVVLLFLFAFLNRVAESKFVADSEKRQEIEGRQELKGRGDLLHGREMDEWES